MVPISPRLAVVVGVVVPLAPQQPEVEAEVGQEALGPQAPLLVAPVVFQQQPLTVLEAAE